MCAATMGCKVVMQKASEPLHEHLRVPSYLQKKVPFFYFMPFVHGYFLLYLLMTFEHGTQPNGSSN
jgi:hypothetical protein